MTVSPPPNFNRKLFARSMLIDRVARWVITLGGVLVIVCVIGILFMIAKVALPLLFAARVTPVAAPALAFPAGGGAMLAVGMDDYLETAWALDAQGVIHFFGVADGQSIDQTALTPPAPAATLLVSADSHGPERLSLLWNDGSVSLAQIRSQPNFDAQGRRTIGHEVLELGSTAASAEDAPPIRALMRMGEEGGLTAVRLRADGSLDVAQQIQTTDLFGNTESEEKRFVAPVDWPGGVTAMTMTETGGNLYAGTENGWLLHWDLSAPGEARLLDRIQAWPDGRAITSLGMVFGDVSVAVGTEKGDLTTWFAVPSTSRGGLAPLTRIHVLQSHPAAVTAITQSRRNKSIISLDAKGFIALDYMTSERHLAEIAAGPATRMVSLNGRTNGLIALTNDGRAQVWTVDNPHPEVSFGTLFGKVHYEGYREPAWVWQSSAANDSYEPKISLTPLLFGTFKGTSYAMLLALPLAILGALYTSQFMSPRTRNWVKPAVEVMAAIPTVVIGFLAGLWLAPMMEQSVLGVFLWFALLPTFVLASMILWAWLDRSRAFRRAGRGREFLFIAPLIILTTALVAWMGPWIEHHWFGGSFAQWLYENMQMRYDQRNSIVIAFALGFAVIPIIFTISEDSLSNIPSSLTAASLALGASRWQTAWRVVLPSASPGIFAAVMIGFGRAVGETMIVLMATGNTPIIDWSLFNGMRTLSANIAVEIPEAPLDGTLYRVLFLTAVLLFVMTFLINTVAEIVRQRLRRKYGSLH